MIKKFLFSAAMICSGILMTTACSHSSSDTPDQKPDDPDKTETPTKPEGIVTAKDFARGADVSWITQQEDEGIKFFDVRGRAADAMQVLKDECGINSIRLRVWVNPADRYNAIPDVVDKAVRARNLGMRVMIDFHFSDTWADPGHQDIPAAWKDLSLADLKIALADHVRATLSALKDAGVSPEWVQVGNETRDGFMYEIGRVNNHFAELADAGYVAVKEVCPDAKVIIHVDNGWDNGVSEWVYSDLAAKGTRYDLIGLSLYPDVNNVPERVSQTVDNVRKLYREYGKRVVICEVGMTYNKPAECADMITRLLQGAVDTGVIDGIFYWEPQAPAGYNGGYDKGAFDRGRPTAGLLPFAQSAAATAAD